MRLQRFLPRPRFSLRVLFIAVTFFAVWLGVHIHRANNQRLAVQAVQQYGGSVFYDFEYDEQSQKQRPDAKPPLPQWLVDVVGVDFLYSVINVHLGSQKMESLNTQQRHEFRNHLQHLPKVRFLLVQGDLVDDQFLRSILVLRRLESLTIWELHDSKVVPRIHRPAITDQSVALLVKFPRLKWLAISGVKLTDESLQTIGTIYQLERLIVGGGSFTDQGLAHLENLTELRELTLQHGETEFSNEGLASLHRMQKLEGLGLRGRTISDDGLQSLTSFKRLKSVFLWTNAITGAGKKRFQTDLPNTKLLIEPYISRLRGIRKVIAWEKGLEVEKITEDRKLHDLGYDDAERVRFYKEYFEDILFCTIEEAKAVENQIARRKDLTVRELATLLEENQGY